MLPGLGGQRAEGYLAHKKQPPPLRPGGQRASGSRERSVWGCMALSWDFLLLHCDPSGVRLRYPLLCRRTPFLHMEGPRDDWVDRPRAKGVEVHVARARKAGAQHCWREGVSAMDLQPFHVSLSPPPTHPAAFSLEERHARL